MAFVVHMMNKTHKKYSLDYVLCTSITIEHLTDGYSVNSTVEPRNFEVAWVDLIWKSQIHVIWGHPLVCQTYTCINLGHSFKLESV